VHPELVSFPLFGKTFTIYTYGTLIVIAFLVAAWWTRRAAERSLGLDRERVFNVGFALLFLGIAGARLVHALAHYADFSAVPMKFIKVWEGGLNGYGGVVAALLWLWWWLPRHPEMKGFALLDVLVRGFTLAFAVGWLAPLLAGDDFGKVTSLPWGIPVSVFEAGTPAASYGWRDPLSRIHPTQVYEGLFALVLFFALAPLSRRGWRAGRLAGLGLMAHAVGHALLDLTRGDETRGMIVPGVLSTGQLLAIAVFFGGLALWVIRAPERHPSGAKRAPAA
jgi:phosphatidylglycerol:prolipoprotein diacylglycerol transferase